MDDYTKPSKALLNALRKSLRPLVKFLLASRITYPQLSELLKSVFVEVAESEFKLADKQQTDSRINFLTGIHRKEVKRLRNSVETEHHLAESSSLGALLVSRWIGHDDYIDQAGNPLPLARLKKQGGDLSFEALVASVNKDIRSRAILDEWLNLGVVHIDDKNQLCLNMDAFIPAQDFDEKAHFFADNLHDHIAASTHNMLDEKPPFMERAVYYDHLSPLSVKTITELAEQDGMQLLKKINQKSLELQNTDQTTPDNNHRYRLGIYFFSDTEEKAANKEN